jgi:holo-[acyl-carrier protein] synthase
MSLRTGMDLVAVASIEDSLRGHGERYLRRVFTDAEVADCRTDRGLDARRLAARFAAKEAALKVMRPGDDAIPWRAIEVRREPTGAPVIVLTGPAAELADRAGLCELAVSLSHEGGFACAVDVAQGPSRKETILR